MDCIFKHLPRDKAIESMKKINFYDNTTIYLNIIKGTSKTNFTTHDFHIKFISV
jgi:hypothetical protein